MRELSEGAQRNLFLMIAPRLNDQQLTRAEFAHSCCLKISRFLLAIAFRALLLLSDSDRLPSDISELLRNAGAFLGLSQMECSSSAV
jgi:hypothetical protein